MIAHGPPCCIRWAYFLFRLTTSSMQSSRCEGYAICRRFLQELSLQGFPIVHILSGQESTGTRCIHLCRGSRHWRHTGSFTGLRLLCSKKINNAKNSRPPAGGHHHSYKLLYFRMLMTLFRATMKLSTSASVL